MPCKYCGKLNYLDENRACPKCWDKTPLGKNLIKLSQKKEKNRKIIIEWIIYTILMILILLMFIFAFFGLLYWIVEGVFCGMLDRCQESIFDWS